MFLKTLKLLSVFFKFKDSLPPTMRSNVVYLYNCPKCQLGTYVGCTERTLKVRMDGHRGVSHRTGITLSVKEQSSIRNHASQCNSRINYNNFKILSQIDIKESLLISEFLYIRQLCPAFNNDTSSVPLYIA